MKLLIDGRTMEKDVYMYVILLTNHQPQAKLLIAKMLLQTEARAKHKLFWCNA